MAPIGAAWGTLEAAGNICSLTHPEKARKVPKLSPAQREWPDLSARTRPAPPPYGPGSGVASPAGSPPEAAAQRLCQPCVDAAARAVPPPHGPVLHKQ